MWNLNWLTSYIANWVSALEVPRYFLTSRWPFWMTSSDPKRWYGIIDNESTLEVNTFSLPFNIVLVDGLLTLSAFAVSVMTKFRPRIYIRSRHFQCWLARHRRRGIQYAKHMLRHSCWSRGSRIDAEFLITTCLSSMLYFTE